MALYHEGILAPETDATFSFSRFADQFDDHIRKSIRGYEDLVTDCVALSQYFVEDDSSVFDIGCSTGRFLCDIKAANADRNPRASYVGIDIEPKFKSHWTSRQSERCVMQLGDVRTFPFPNDCSLVTSIFSLQFIPERDRQQILNRIYRSLVPGGALIVAEKMLFTSPKVNDLISSIHYDFKRRSFSEFEIQGKAHSLRSLMKTWSTDQIVQSLVAAGFTPPNVQPIWQNHAFAAFVALR